jgi:hypothetical protein
VVETRATAAAPCGTSHRGAGRPVAVHHLGCSGRSGTAGGSRCGARPLVSLRERGAAADAVRRVPGAGGHRSSLAGVVRVAGRRPSALSGAGLAGPPTGGGDAGGGLAPAGAAVGRRHAAPAEWGRSAHGQEVPGVHCRRCRRRTMITLRATTERAAGLGMTGSGRSNPVLVAEPPSSMTRWPRPSSSEVTRAVPPDGAFMPGRIPPTSPGTRQRAAQRRSGVERTVKVTRVAEWTGWCGPCGRQDRPLVLTRSGPAGLWAWLSGVGDEDCSLQLTCRVCGQWQVVPRVAEGAALAVPAPRQVRPVLQPVPVSMGSRGSLALARLVGAPRSPIERVSRLVRRSPQPSASLSVDGRLVGQPPRAPSGRWVPTVIPHRATGDARKPASAATPSADAATGAGTPWPSVRPRTPGVRQWTIELALLRSSAPAHRLPLPPPGTVPARAWDCAPAGRPRSEHEAPAHRRLGPPTGPSPARAPWAGALAPVAEHEVLHLPRLPGPLQSCPERALEEPADDVAVQTGSSRRPVDVPGSGAPSPPSSAAAARPRRARRTGPTPRPVTGRRRPESTPSSPRSAAAPG